MEELGCQVEEKRRAAAAKGERVLSVAHAIVLEAEQVGVRLRGDDVAESVLEIAFPKETVGVGTHKVDELADRFVLDAYHGWVDAAIDRRQRGARWAARVGKVMDGSELC